MKRRPVSVRVSASTSNLGPGFDVLGLALSLHNEAEFLPVRDPKDAGVEIHGEGAGRLPLGGRNLVLRSFLSFLPSPLRGPWKLRLTNRIPLARGLGSSAAARLAGFLAAAALKGQAPQAALDAAIEGEGHPDNASAAFHGGLCACVPENGGRRVLRLRVPPGLGICVCVPDFELSTKRARAVLPRRVPLGDCVRTSARLLALGRSLESGDFASLRWAMRDVLHEPYRERLVPGLGGARAAALKAGAFGAALSGSGPSVLALCPPARREAVGEAMRRAFARAGKAARSLPLRVESRPSRAEFARGSAGRAP